MGKLIGATLLVAIIIVGVFFITHSFCRDSKDGIPFIKVVCVVFVAVLIGGGITTLIVLSANDTYFASSVLGGAVVAIISACLVTIITVFVGPNATLIAAVAAGLTALLVYIIAAFLASYTALAPGPSTVSLSMQLPYLVIEFLVTFIPMIATIL